MKNAFSLLMGLYLGLAPVYWWPGVPAGIFEIFKLSLIAIAVIIIWFHSIAASRITLPGGILGPTGLILIILASVPGLLQTDTHHTIQLLKDYILTYVMFWTFYMYQSNFRNANKIFTTAALIIALHCTLVATSKLTGIPSWSGPRHFIATELWISGFGSLRTGWSNSTSLYIPVLLGLVSSFTFKRYYVKWFYICAAMVIFVSCVIVGGRAGILACLTATGLILIKKGNKLLLIVLSIAAIFITISLSDFLYHHLRFDQLGSTASSTDLDKFSAGRMGSNLFALQMILDKPLSGYGFGEGMTHGTEFHNLWLKLGVESGVFLPLTLVIQVFVILLIAKKKYFHIVTTDTVRLQKFDGVAYAHFVLLIIGLMISMFEPRFILGSFQLSAIWWAVAGTVIAKMNISSKDRKPPTTISHRSTGAIHNIETSAGKEARDDN